MTFEEAIKRLEYITKKMDDSSVTLEESLSLFEEGISLIKLCNNKLDTAEKKIKILMSEKDDYVEKDFSLEKNSND